MEPQILLLDEPTSALDPELVTEVLDVIKQAALEGNTMIIVSHEMDFVRQVANRVFFWKREKSLRIAANSRYLITRNTSAPKPFWPATTDG